MKYKKGFTLIELLVVIAIITLLSSVVLGTLNVGRVKGADSAVKAAMKQLHAQSQNYLDSIGSTSFGTANTCIAGLFADARFTSILANIGVNDNPASPIVCGSLGNNWAVSVTLKSGGTWCTDNSQGWMKAGSANTATGLCGP